MGKIISIGIDPSFTGTGVVILIEGQLYHSTTILTDPNKGILDRVDTVAFGILNALNKAFQRYSKNEDKFIVSIEGFSYSSKGRAVFQIGYLGWKVREIIDDFCRDKDIEWIDIPPNNLKLYATGKGNCAKELIMLQVYKRWNAEFSDNNQADAFVLAKMAHSYILGNEGLTDFQIKSMDAVRSVNK